MIGGLKLVNDLDHLLAVESAIRCVADHDARREATATHAGDLLEGEHLVFGGLATLAAQVLLERFTQTLGATHVARGSVAYLDNVLSNG